jgi:hypothetical protein
METPKAQRIMQEYLAGKKLDSYLPAYCARRKNNHHVLLEVCEELKKHGVDCYTERQEYERERTSLIYAVKDGKYVCFGFAEVPFRWYVGSEHSCWRWPIGEHGYGYPYEVEDILSKINVPLSKYEKSACEDQRIRIKL